MSTSVVMYGGATPYALVQSAKIQRNCAEHSYRADPSVENAALLVSARNRLIDEKKNYNKRLWCWHFVLGGMTLPFHPLIRMHPEKTERERFYGISDAQINWMMRERPALCAYKRVW